MALNRLQQEGLDMLDLSKGGGFLNFTSNKNRLETQEHKFLFVGFLSKNSLTDEIPAAKIIMARGTIPVKYLISNNAPSGLTKTL